MALSLQGDLEDRNKIRQFDVQRERLAKQQAQADETAMEARTLASMGYDADAICRDLDKSKTPYSRTYIEKLVADEQRKQDERDSPPDSSPEPSEAGLEISAVGARLFLPFTAELVERLSSKVKT